MYLFSAAEKGSNLHHRKGKSRAYLGQQPSSVRKQHAITSESCTATCATTVRTATHQRLLLQHGLERNPHRKGSQACTSGSWQQSSITPP